MSRFRLSRRADATCDTHVKVSRDYVAAGSAVDAISEKKDDRRSDAQGLHQICLVLWQSGY
jgi:hypothetical protein